MENVFEFTSANEISKLLGEGDHVVRVAEVGLTEAAAKEDYADRTPQLEVKFVGKGDKFITCWFNLKGYCVFEELPETEKKSGNFEPRGSMGYATDVTNDQRITSQEKTKAALNIVAKLGNDAGIPTGSKFQPKNLLGLVVGVHVTRNTQGQLRVGYSMPATQVVEPATA